MGDSPRMRWFRVYDEDVLDDPRIGALSATNLGHYIRILAASSRQKRRGLVPSLVDLGFLLRLKKRRDVDRIIKIMLDAGLITEIAPNQYKITDWDEKQFPSDNSTSRWHKHMEAKRANVGANVGRALAQTCPDSELDTETEEEGGDNSRTRACESPPEPPPPLFSFLLHGWMRSMQKARMPQMGRGEVGPQG